MGSINEIEKELEEKLGNATSMLKEREIKTNSNLKKYES